MLVYLQALLSKLQNNQKGQDLTEYALLVALIAIVVVAAVIIFGNAISSWFASLPGKIKLS